MANSRGRGKAGPVEPAARGANARAPLPALSHTEVMRRVQRACDDLVERVTRDHVPPVSCRAGCAHCCRQPVFITPLEGAAIRDYVTATRQAESIRRSTARYLRELRARPHADAGLAALQRNVQGIGKPPTDTQRAAIYGPACPFLRDNRCSIYPVRPFMCREHISFDDPGKCERDEPFLGLDKPRFAEVSAYLSQGAVPPREQAVPVWEYERAARGAEAVPPVKERDVNKVLGWKTGR